ncbi:E1A-binding protein p400-like [Triticum urartu]|uniref:E1A-binding protein p400-like n=1 Tax=Triticum urartu TaxID=4572 RepID=UPI002043B245|nr:E1A-binding protein p400-like [Triticum urartu]
MPEPPPSRSLSLSLPNPTPSRSPAPTSVAAEPSAIDTSPYTAARRCSQWPGEPPRVVTASAPVLSRKHHHRPLPLQHAPVASVVAAPRIPWPRPAGACQRALAQAADTATVVPLLWRHAGLPELLVDHPNNSETAADVRVFDYIEDDPPSCQITDACDRG